MVERQNWIPCILVVFALIFSLNTVAYSPQFLSKGEPYFESLGQVAFIDEINSTVIYDYDSSYVGEKAKHTKLNAVLLAITLGPFGVHRLYLGTEAKVPVIYTLTLGGGLGILPLVDIVAILATPSLELYEDNSKVIMWAK